MNIVKFLRSKLNKYSVIGSLVYGVICVTGTIMTPEITSKTIYVLGFISACMFYFAMYVLYSRRKKRTWKELGMFIINIFIKYSIAHASLAMFYMVLFSISFGAAIDMVARHIADVGYYIPFLP